MRSFIPAALGVCVILGLAILATTWHSWVSWDFAVSIRPPDRMMVLGVLVVAVALVWRWASSRRE